MEKDNDSTANKTLQIITSVVPNINLALQQNSFPIITELKITNNTDQIFSDIQLHLSSSPAFIQEKTWAIDRISENTQQLIHNHQVTLDAEFLKELNEALPGELIFTLKKGETILDRKVQKIRLLTKDEWGGFGILPEIISAFVQPNDPSVQSILRDASKILEKSGEKSSLEGYQSKSPRRVAFILSAIWSAISKLDLTYANPPSSFEEEGQRIRLPSKIFETRMATCLDTTLLFASCIEQVGLNGLIVFTEGHAFVGAWLVEDDFSQSVVYEAQALRKRCQLKELLVFETTLIANNPPVPFKIAIQEANNKLENDAEFRIAVDVKRTRMASIKPLSDNSFVNIKQQAPIVDEVKIKLDTLTDIPEKAEIQFDANDKTAPNTPEARVENWKRQLLDLTMRNRLLNFTSKARAIHLECYLPGRLEDLLSDGKSFKILSTETLNLDRDPRSAELHTESHHENLRKERVNQLLEKKELVAKQDDKKLQTDLLELYRLSIAAIQEGGSNILYIALGKLSWQQAGKDGRTYQAPLVLIPVELTRKSVQLGFSLKLHEDEPRFNPTLLQMLKQDFKLEIPELAGELPTDEQGLDINAIWDIVRRHVRDIPHWEVTEDIAISTFSFSKYLMWVDLCERIDQLKKCPVVEHLIESPRDPYQASNGVEFPNISKLDEIKHPKDSYIPMLADSSQMAAIVAAEKGKDFVLIGPPGTGKSQTITNMISQLLASGKTVLFVSEKTAALDVVYRRLQKVGLGEHCLELHSSKAKKAEVIKQLGIAWERKCEFKANWDREANRLAALRDKLNTYVQHLHKKAPNGLTPYKAIGVAIKNQAIPKIKLNWQSTDSLNIDSFEQLQNIARRIDVNSADLETISNHPLTEVHAENWSPTWQNNLIASAKILQQNVITLEGAAKTYLDLLKTENNIFTLKQLLSLKKISEYLPKAFAENFSFALQPKGRQHTKDLLQVASLIETYNKTMLETKIPFDREVLSLPLKELKNTWAASEENWFLLKWMKQRKIKKQLEPFAQKGLANETIFADLEKLIEATEIQTNIEKFSVLSDIIGKKWDGIDTDTKWLQNACEWSETMLAAIAGFSQDPDSTSKLKAKVQLILEENNDLLEPGLKLDIAGKSLQQKFANFHIILQQIKKEINQQEDSFLDAKPDSNYYDNSKKIIQNWLENEKALKYWCAWRKARQEAVQGGIKPLIDAFEQGITQNHSIESLLMVNYCRWWINAVVDQDKVLREFVPAEHRDHIEEYQKIDLAFMHLTRACVGSRLASRIPNKKEVPKKSGWGILARELQKKIRHIPVRQLIANLDETLTQLTPCVMMSPMSIAQYLPANSQTFDVVIFDEASQITVCDAIGAIARAKQAIIVGDPKQLPPTSFFGKKADQDEEDDDFDEDLESILDECLAANIPSLKLNWHYRSRCESLITFSNRRYYDGTLITFPNNNTKGMSVSFHPVDSVYKEGKSRVNRGEAQAIVDDIVTKLQNPNFSKSIGVVTFNAEQQLLISNLFEKARGDHPEIEPHFSEDKFDSVFVKNLESVQGDERDIIYFSITFGKDSSGKVSMNFGPMNKNGGTRRLNVAITRAKEEMMIFSSLKPEEIDLSRTASEGVKDLKHFLEYAQRGATALEEATDKPSTGGWFDSPFEEVVAKRLKQKGWEVRSQVGVSGFRIDLGIINPEAPNRYLAAIECDGATYHRSATARDRDHLRESVLRGLGWEVLRIWSTDWWIDSESAIEKLDSQLHAILKNKTS